MCQRGEIFSEGDLSPIFTRQFLFLFQKVPQVSRVSKCNLDFGIPTGLTFCIHMQHTEIGRLGGYCFDTS